MAQKTCELERMLPLLALIMAVALISFFAYPLVFPPQQGCAAPATGATPVPCNAPAAGTNPAKCAEPANCTGANAGTLPASGSTGCAITPEFDDPAVKLAELSGGNFSYTLFTEAVAFEPLLNASGTQAHMGYWSGAGNHGSLVRLLDSINNYRPAANESVQRAIWDEGAQSSLQYPAYVEMNARENWYARAYPVGGKAIVYGMEYTDPYPVSPAQADDIWGGYSERYGEMAGYIRNATGNAVQVWCFVQGAKANRVFYKYEYPVLQRLEQEGVVQVHFAKSQDADWKNPADWSDGTASAPPPAN